MSNRSANTVLSRTLAQTRASSIAGPSRLCPTLSHSRALATEASPAPPALNPKKSTNKLVVRTSKPMSSILHAYAVLRSIEDTYGPVLDFEVGKDPDSLRPTSILFFTMSKSIEYEANRLHEIPAPRSSLNELERYGGPSWEDVKSVLRSDPSRALPAGHGKNQSQVITFEVEARKKSRNATTIKTRKPDNASIKRDIRLAEALEKFDGGFFGGFAGLGTRYKPIFENLKKNVGEKDQRPRARNSGSVRRAGDRPETASGEAQPKTEPEI